CCDSGQITLINNTNRTKLHKSRSGNPPRDASLPSPSTLQGGTVELTLTGQVAIVTGVGKGIGREIVHTLAREGVTTVALDISESDLASLADELAEVGGEHAQYVCDVRDRARIQEIVAD